MKCAVCVLLVACLGLALAQRPRYPPDSRTANGVEIISSWGWNDGKVRRYPPIIQDGPTGRNYRPGSIDRYRRRFDDDESLWGGSSREAYPWTLDRSGRDRRRDDSPWGGPSRNGNRRRNVWDWDSPPTPIHRSPSRGRERWDWNRNPNQEPGWVPPERVGGNLVDDFSLEE